MFISDEDIKQFSEDGALVLRNVFRRVKVRAQFAAVHLLFCSSDWVEIVKRGIEVNLARPSKYSERLAVQEGQVRL